ncbi:MAG: isochorismatase family cysteine hydrolase [Terracidiphilus sp.]
MKNPVLIVIDMLNDYLAQWEPAQRHKLVQSINELIRILRDRSLPILWVRQEFDPDLSDAFPEMKAKGIHITIKGTVGCRIAPELALAPSDTVFVKKRYSAFFGTNLDETLVRLKPDTIILAGINTHACIRTTAIDAYQRDWPVVLAADCIDSYDRAHHEVSLKYMKGKIAAVLTNREIESALQSRE